MRVGLYRKLSAEALILLNCGVGEDWVPWTARRSNQSILKEISPECSLEGLMLKLKLQYFGHLMWRTDSLEKTLMLGKIEGGRRREQQRMRGLVGIPNSMEMSLSKLQDLVMDRVPGVLQFMGSQRVRCDWVTELTWTANFDQIVFLEMTFWNILGWPKSSCEFFCTILWKNPNKLLANPILIQKSKIIFVDAFLPSAV